MCVTLSYMQRDLLYLVQRTRKMNYRWPKLCRKGSQNIIFLLYSFSHWNVFININFSNASDDKLWEMKNMFSCVWSTSSEDTRHVLHSHGPVHENSLTVGLNPFAFRTTRNENLTATLFSPVQWKQTQKFFSSLLTVAAGQQRNPSGVGDLVMRARFGVHRTVTTNITTFRKKMPWIMLISYKPRRNRLLSSVWYKS